MENEYEVEEIVDMKISHETEYIVSFRVRWEGYSEIDDLWLPVTDLSCEDLVHAYLDSSGRWAEYERAMSKQMEKQDNCDLQNEAKENCYNYLNLKECEAVVPHGRNAGKCPKSDFTSPPKIMNISDETIDFRGFSTNKNISHPNSLPKLSADDKDIDFHSETMLRLSDDESSYDKEIDSHSEHLLRLSEDESSYDKVIEVKAEIDLSYSSQPAAECEDRNVNIDIKTETFEEEQMVEGLLGSTDCWDESNGLPVIESVSGNVSVQIKQDNFTNVRGSGRNSLRLPSGQVKRNYATCSANQQFSCDSCPFVAQDKKSLRKHRALHTADKEFPCDLCSYVARSKSDINKHVILHVGKESVQCTLCSHRALCKAVLTRHMRSAHNCSYCKFCPYKSKSKIRLKKHMKNMHQRKIAYSCESCAFVSCYLDKFKAHMSDHRKNDIKEKLSSCESSPCQTEGKSSISEHMLSNSCANFKCTLCPFSTYNESDLQMHHSVIHDAENRFCCKFCSFKTRNPSILDEHLLLHNVEKAFTCDLCSFSTNHEVLFQQHVLIHREHKAFSCDYCSFKTNYQLTLQQHLYIHNVENLFPCELCSYQTNTREKLKQHSIIHMTQYPFRL